MAAATIGVSLTAGVTYLLLRIRFGRLVKAAERIAAGDYTTTVKARGGGLEGASRPRRQRHLRRADRDQRPRHLRSPDRRRQPPAPCSRRCSPRSSAPRRYERPLSVAFVDIDHFKAVNDTYGHAAGDVVLRGVAQTLGANLRASDMIGRYGGEEFMLILTETDVEEGAVLTEKLRNARPARSTSRSRAAPDLTVTISIGIAGGSGTQLRVETLVRDADAAMYSAKSLGRNQTYIFAEPDDDARVPRAPISDGGPGPGDGDRPAGPRCGDRRPRVVHPAAPPLPRPAVGADRLDRGRDRRASCSCPEAEIDRIQVAALLHDVGKVAVPEEILEKPSALSTGRVADSSSSTRASAR